MKQPVFKAAWINMDKSEILAIRNHVITNDVSVGVYSFDDNDIK